MPVAQQFQRFSGKFPKHMKREILAANREVAGKICDLSQTSLPLRALVDSEPIPRKAPLINFLRLVMHSLASGHA